MSQIVSLMITEGKRKRYDEAIRHINKNQSLNSIYVEDKQAVQTLLNLCKMVVDVYDRKERGELQENAF